MTPEERKKVNPRVVLFAGKAAPGYYMAKLVVSLSGVGTIRGFDHLYRQIRLIVSVSKVINNDPDVKGILTLLFLPDYSVSRTSRLPPMKDTRLTCLTS